MTGPIETILESALRAPSGDNTQPVRFRVDDGGRTIALAIDPASDPSPMNAGQRMARLAAGASLENLVRSAEAMGYAVEVGPAEGEALAVVRLVGSPSGTPTTDGAARSRVTNRRLYDGRAIPADLLDRLGEATPSTGGVSTHWIVDRGRLGRLAGLIGEADALMFGEPSMRRAFLSQVRFDRPTLAEVDRGLSLGSLEVGLGERLALGAMRGMPDRIFKLAGAPGVLASKARQLARSASGLCLGVAPDGLDATDVVAGRSWQRAWLALSTRGLAAQPMMSLMVLENVAERGDRGLIDALGRAKLSSLRERFRAEVPEVAGRRPAWLLRFGYSRPPTGRTGRLPVEAVVTRPGGGPDRSGAGRPALEG